MVGNAGLLGAHTASAARRLPLRCDLCLPIVRPAAGTSHCACVCVCWCFFLFGCATGLALGRFLQKKNMRVLAVWQLRYWVVELVASRDPRNRVSLACLPLIAVVCRQKSFDSTKSLDGQTKKVSA